MLPKFLIADNSQELPEKIFIVHTMKPRYIVESDIEDFNTDQKIYWLDEPITDNSVISQLLKEAEEFFDTELDSQDELFDETFNNN